MNNSKTLGLLYLWRLEEEKGFWLLLERLQNFQGEKLPFDLYIFGQGNLEPQLLELTGKRNQLHFFGRKPLSEVERYLENIDYCLMPSLCLETFGLSAINVLSRGIPVVGFQKWGLKPFVLDDYALNLAKGKDNAQKFDATIASLITEKKNKKAGFYTQLAEKCQSLAKRYTPEARFEQFQSLIFDFKCKKIVLVSDFINKIGGIETYLHDVKTLLESKGYQVHLFGSHCPKGFWGKVKKYFGLGASAFNLWEGIRLHFFLKKHNPDLIWFHSLIRRNGRLPLWIARSSTTKKRMMYHDLGYFHPFPSQVSDEKQVKKLTFLSFLKMATSKNPLKLLLVAGKYLSLALLRPQLRKLIDCHLVPSSFMTPMISQAYKVKGEKIQTFPHFVQK